MAEATEAAAVSAMAAVAIEDKITSSIPGTRDPAYRVQTDTHTPVFRFTEEGATAGNSSGKFFHGLTGSLQTGIIRLVM